LRIPNTAAAYQVMEWKDFVPALNDKCLCLTPFCDEVEVLCQEE